MIRRFAKLFQLASSKAIDSLAGQVAEACTESVYQRVVAQVEAMTLSEARGYVRARASQLVRRQTRLAISQTTDAKVDWSEQIVRVATERIVPRVLRQAAVGVPCVARIKVAA